MRSSWIASALASSLCFGAGCAGMGMGAGRVDQAKLGRLPMEQKREVFTAQHNVEVARANAKEVEEALGRAKEFGKIAETERKAAESRVEAARKLVELGREGQGTEPERVARRNLELAEQQLGAERAKVDFADNVVRLREAESTRSSKQVTAAEADVRLTEFRALERGGEAVNKDALNQATSAREKAYAEVAEAERQVSALRDVTQTRQAAWDQARERYNVAARQGSPLPPSRAPQSAPRIQPEPLREPSTGPTPMRRGDEPKLPESTPE